VNLSGYACFSSAMASLDSSLMFILLVAYHSLEQYTTVQATQGVRIELCASRI
jgi:hypothetical protein